MLPGEQLDFAVQVLVHEAAPLRSGAASWTRTWTAKSSCSPGSMRTASRSCGSRRNVPSTTPRKSPHDDDGCERDFRYQGPETRGRGAAPYRVGGAIHAGAAP